MPKIANTPMTGISLKIPVSIDEQIMRDVARLDREKSDVIRRVLSAWYALPLEKRDELLKTARKS